MGSGAVGKRVATEGQVAFDCGYAMHHPAMTVDEARRTIITDDGRNMSEAERAAYRSLMPATWWANFQRGWAAAEHATSNG